MNTARARGLVLERLNELPALHELEVGAPGRGEVRVRMSAAGVCHTDVSSVRDARTTPLLLGHEGAGVVESVGPGVNHPEPGAPVLLCWKVPCGSCRRCRVGNSELCEDIVALREPRTSHRGQPIQPLLNAGCFCELVVVPAEACIPLPPELPLDLAALVGCAVATGVGAVLRTACVEPGATIVVWGAGGVGLNVVTGAVIAGASAVIAVDPDPQRRVHALARGATHACAPDQAGALVTEATGRQGVDYAFEAVGDPEVMTQALDCLDAGGRLVLIGAAARDAVLTFHPRAFMSRQQRIIGCIYGSLRPHVDLPVLLEWAVAGRIRLDDLVGRRISLDQLPDVFGHPTDAGVRTMVIFP